MDRRRKKSIEAIVKGYSPLGLPAKELLPTFSHHECRYWRNHLMSPTFLLKRSLRAKDLQALEEYYTSEQRKGAFESNKAHMYVIDAPYYDLEKIDQVTQKNGWACHKNSAAINFWTSPLAINLPKEFYLAMGDYKSLNLRADFTEVLQKNFSVSPQFVAELHRMLKSLTCDLKVVIIYSQRSKRPCASGLVATKGAFSYLLFGSVNKRMRRRGLWRSLIAARQAISYTGAEHFWITTTQANSIRKKGEISFDLHLYERR